MPDSVTSLFNITEKIGVVMVGMQGNKKRMSLNYLQWTISHEGDRFLYNMNREERMLQAEILFFQNDLG